MDLPEALKQLAAAGIQPEAIDNLQIICLPENIFASERKGELFEAQDSLSLLKRLKEVGVHCAGPMDFGLEVGVLARHSGDRWLGVVWIRDVLVMQLLIGIIAGLIVNRVDHAAPAPEKAVPPRQPKIHVELYVEKQDQLKHLVFDGDGETLIKVLEGLKEQ